jgi:hypothetical protein
VILVAKAKKEGRKEGKEEEIEMRGFLLKMAEL